jgi:hypothetical protein
MDNSNRKREINNITAVQEAEDKPSILDVVGDGNHLWRALAAAN